MLLHKPKYDWFRRRTEVSHGGDVIEEMDNVLKIMYDFRYLGPVIAGGCLWSWAAGQKSRDVDIFFQDSGETMDALSNFDKVYKNPEEDFMGMEVTHDEYGDIVGEQERAIRVFNGKIKSSDTAIQLTVTQEESEYITNFFDYEHVRVSWSPHNFVTDGAKFYAKAILQLVDNVHARVPGNARSEEKIMSKIIAKMWGNPHAHAALSQVGRFLNNGYNQLVSVKNYEDIPF